MIDKTCRNYGVEPFKVLEAQKTSVIQEIKEKESKRYTIGQ